MVAVAPPRLNPVENLPPEMAFAAATAEHLVPIALGESAPEVRALSSAGITRPYRSYYPVRLPPGPPYLPRRWRCDLQPKRASRDYPNHLPSVPCPLPRWIGEKFGSWSQAVAVIVMIAIAPGILRVIGALLEFIVEPAGAAIEYGIMLACLDFIKLLGAVGGLCLGLLVWPFKAISRLCGSWQNVEEGDEENEPELCRVYVQRFQHRFDSFEEFVIWVQGGG